jgi:hypothetical protein
MKTGQGFLLVFSITSQSSFYELAELREQIRRIKEDDNVPMVLIGNKSDLEEDRAIPRPRAFAISREWNIPYFETSARRRANVDEAFVDLCRQIIMKDQALRRHIHADRKTPQTGEETQEPAKLYDSLSYDTPMTANLLALCLLDQAFFFMALVTFFFIGISIYHRGRRTARSGMSCRVFHISILMRCCDPTIYNVDLHTCPFAQTNSVELRLRLSP